MTFRQISNEEAERIANAARRLDRWTIGTALFAVAVLVLGTVVVLVGVPETKQESAQGITNQRRVEGTACVAFIIPCLILTARFLLEGYHFIHTGRTTLQMAIRQCLIGAIPIAIFIGAAIELTITAFELWK